LISFYFKSKVNELPLFEKLDILVNKGFSEYESAINLCLNNGDIEKTLGSLYLNFPLRKRFKLECNACFEGTYQMDGIFNNACRYRHGENDKMWIIFIDNNWCLTDDPEGKKTRIISLQNCRKGRRVNGIQEIPTLGWSNEDNLEENKIYGPYQFSWVIN